MNMHVALAPPPSAGLVLDAHMPYRLSAAADAVTRLIARAYEDRFGLSAPQWRVMCVLAEGPGERLADVAARSRLDAMVLGRAVADLLRRRLARRCGGAADDGGPRLVLTAQGARLYGEIAPLALAYEAALSAGLAPGEVAVLKRLLARLQAAALTLAGEAAR